MITDRQRSAQADTGHPLLCGKPYELFLVCPADCLWGPGASDDWEGVCVGSGGVSVLWLSAGGAGGAQSESKITSVSHCSFILYFGILLMIYPTMSSFFLNWDSFWWIKYDQNIFNLLVFGWRRARPRQRNRHRPSNTCREVSCVYVCVWASVSVTDTVSSGRPQLRSVQRSMQDSLSKVESWRKVIPGLSMIKLTPHRVSQILFCALDTVAAAYSTLSRIQSRLSCWHHCIAITVSERENALEAARWEEDRGNVISVSLCLSVFLLPLIWSSTNQGLMEMCIPLINKDEKFILATNIGHFTSEKGFKKSVLHKCWFTFIWKHTSVLTKFTSSRFLLNSPFLAVFCCISFSQLNKLYVIKLYVADTNQNHSSEVCVSVSAKLDTKLTHCEL